MYRTRIQQFLRMNKYDRIGYHVTWEARQKHINCLENYDEILEQLEDQLRRRNLKADGLLNDDEEDSFLINHDGKIQQLGRRNFGGKLVRIGTPVERINPGDIPSPSNNKADIMILPGVSLAQSEANKKANQLLDQQSSKMSK